MGYSLGIDFGTSATKVALRRANEMPLALAIGNKRELFMPSVVAYKRTKNDMAELMAVGEDAIKVPEDEDTHVVREVKRFFHISESAGKNFPYERYPWWNSRDRCIQLWASKFSLHDVVWTILSEALERAVRYARGIGFGGTDVDRFSIRGLPTRLGCSVKGGLETRQVLAEVARRLGFPKFRVNGLVEEPILASLPYVHQEVTPDPDEIVLVYDLGGGTFDTAVVKVHRESQDSVPVLTIFAADGEPFCGGADIDEALFRHLMYRIAEEYFGFQKEERLQILDMMNADEKQKLRNQACDAKERLSEAEDAKVALPPGFLGKAEAIKLNVKRTEVEAVVKDIRLIDETLGCVLRAWRRARMLLRRPGEAIGTFHLQYDRSSGRLGGSVMQLDHSDLREMVNKILLVGGTTHMPIIKNILASLWGQDKFVPEDEPVKRITACSVGAAWQQESVSTIVDRLPFSISVRWDSGKSTLYKAFTPTVDYRTLTTSPSINPFQSGPFSPPRGYREVCVIFETPDGETKVVLDMANLRSPYTLEIDLFGRCILKDGLDTLHELPNPSQHPLQKESWDRLEDKRRREEEDQGKKTKEYLRRPPGADLYEVG